MIFVRDWSSDVCSSDLGSRVSPSSAANPGLRRPGLSCAGITGGSRSRETPKAPAISRFQVISFLAVLYRAVRDAEEGSMAKDPVSYFSHERVGMAENCGLPVNLRMVVLDPEKAGQRTPSGDLREDRNFR